MLAKLKLRIIERYRTQSRFSVSCGRPEHWISRIVQQRDVASDDDRRLIARKLRIRDAEVKEFFGNEHKR